MIRPQAILPATPVFYRQKVLLALLETLNRQVPRTDLQKYLFLLSREQQSPSYHFVPYRFGCYSFHAEVDKHNLTRRELLKPHAKWVLNSGARYVDALSPADRCAIEAVVDRFRRVQGRDLLRHVYRTYPYFAINSNVLDDVLDPRESARVEASRPPRRQPHLFTIGYEGKSLEQFLNVLIRESVSVLCDVRRNPISRKYGFSKRTLMNACNWLGIDYVHKPELGVDSQSRKNLHSPADYQSLFRHYCQTTLVELHESLNSIALILQRDHSRIALTCFEADADHCHRGCIANAIRARPDFPYGVTHL